MNLWKHQLKAVEMARKQPHLGLFLEVGTGKTATMIHILREDYNGNRKIAPTLIFCPLSVCEQWKREFAKFSKVDPQKILVLTGTGRKRTREFVQAILKDPGRIVISNYESVQMAELYAQYLKWQPEILVLDESHRIKDSASVRARKIYPLADAARRRFLLTGTPILNSLMDIFGQYRALDSRHFGDSFWRFRGNHFYDANAGMPSHKHFPNWQPFPNAAERIGQILAATSVQAKKSECLDLPPLMKEIVHVPLGDKQRKSYEQMEREFITSLGDVTSVAEFAMTKTLRLQQICAGFLAENSEGEAAWYDDVPRLDALRDLLDSIGPHERVIIWTIFRPTYATITDLCQKMGRRVVHLTGEQSAIEKETAIYGITEGEANVMIAHPQAGGTGVNLVQPKYSIYYSRGYSLEQFVQSEARNHRAGSEMHEKVVHYHLVSSGTIDEAIAEALLEKKSLADAVLNYARKKEARL